MVTSLIIRPYNDNVKKPRAEKKTDNNDMRGRRAVGSAHVYRCGKFTSPACFFDRPEPKFENSYIITIAIRVHVLHAGAYGGGRCVDEVGEEPRIESLRRIHSQRSG